MPAARMSPAPEHQCRKLPSRQGSQWLLHRRVHRRSVIYRQPSSPNPSPPASPPVSKPTSPVPSPAKRLARMICRGCVTEYSPGSSKSPATSPSPIPNPNVSPNVITNREREGDQFSPVRYPESCACRSQPYNGGCRLRADVKRTCHPMRGMHYPAGLALPQLLRRLGCVSAMRGYFVYRFRCQSGRPGWAVGRAARVRVVCAGVAATVMALAVLAAVTGALPPGRAALARADDVTASLDNLRSGWDPNEPGLSPSVVGGGTFGQVFSTAVNGQVYAQPLVVGSTVIVATENDWVYGLNATTGAVEWSDSLGTPYNITTCGDLTPNIGVTGSPIYDPANGNVYLIAQIMRSSGPAYRLYGINAQTGGITKRRWIGGSPTNDPSISFNGAQQLERPGLLLMNGWVYAAFGSHCDHNPYVGFVVGAQLSSSSETLWTDESGVTDNQAGIWHAGGGLMSDGPGRIFFTSGNGISPPPGPGTSPPGQLAESTVRLAVQSNGSLAAQDFFSPANAPSLDAADTDLGSGGPVGLPFGTSTYPDLLVQIGKDGRIFLLNRDNLGGREQGTGGTDAAVGVFGPYAGQWGHPAVFADTPALTASNTATANDYLYYVGKNSYLRVLKAVADSSGTPTLSDVANSSFTFGYTSGSPVVTSNGTDPASAIVWIVYASGSTGSSAMLDAFAAAQPSTCTSSAPCTQTPIWSAPIGTASKFTTLVASNGMVYVGTRDGHVLGFGITTAA